MSVTDLCPPTGIPRPLRAGIADLALQILALAHHDPRLVVCSGGVTPEPLTHDELSHLHGRMADYSADDWLPRLLATVEALRVAP